MAREIVILDRSRPTSADLSASQFCAVVLNTSSQIALAGDGVAVYGVLQDKPKVAGRAGSVRVLGVTKMLVGVGGVTAGDIVSATSTGAAQTADSGDYGIGYAEDTGAEGTYTTVLLLPQGKQ